MNNSPLVSVCMLTYNHEAYIAEAIQSVLDQSYENWELIIVDNASTDNTRKVIESLVGTDKRITFMPQETNLYVSKGANIAMQRAKGEYIALFSGDDVYHEKKLEKHIAFMLAEELDLSFSWIEAIDSHSKPSAPDVQKWFNDEGSITKTDILKKYFEMHNVTCAPTAIVKHSLLKKTSLFDHRLLQTQDMELWIRLMHLTDKVKIFHESLTLYRVLENGENLSSNNTLEKKNRTNFEMLYVGKGLFSLDNNTLSKVLECDINDNNKYFAVYEYLKDNDIDIWQYAMLIDIYSKLTEKCKVDSELFTLFFNEYGNFSIMNLKTLENIDKAQTWLEEQVESHKKTLIEKDKAQTWLEEQLENHKKDLSKKEESIYRYQDEIIEAENHIIMRDEILIEYQNILDMIDEEILLMEKEHESRLLDLSIKEQRIMSLSKSLAYRETFKGLTRGLAKKIILKIKRIF